MSFKLLFIGHDASRTGAPIVLLHLLRWLKNNTDTQLLVVLKKGGTIEKDFSAIAETLVWSSEGRRKKWYKSFFHKIGWGKDSKQQKAIIEKLHLFNPDLIYANSVVSLDLSVDLKRKLNCPLICHVHELDVAIDRYFGKEKFLQAKDRVDHFIGVSDAVVNNLLNTYQINDNIISKINPFIPALEYSKKKSTNTALKNSLEIPENAFIVGGCGTLDWRKSPDVFIQVANLVMQRKYAQSIYFVWVGGGEIHELNQLRYDLEKLKLDNVLFVGKQKEPMEYFSIFDMFLLTSREDPYPLVCLEAAALGKPIICFSEAGGMPEFVTESDNTDNYCGYVVPYLNVNEMANKIETMLENKEIRQGFGDNAKNKVIEEHDTSVAVTKIMNIVTKIVLP